MEHLDQLDNLSLLVNTSGNLGNQSLFLDGWTLGKKLLSWDDATWILTSTFITFTMQSGGFHLLCNSIFNFHYEFEFLF